MWLGNTTVLFSDQNPVAVTGTDGQHFRRGLTVGDKVTIWQESMMRPIDFQATADTSVLVRVSAVMTQCRSLLPFIFCLALLFRGLFTSHVCFSTLQGIPTVHFEPTADLLSGNDPRYQYPGVSCPKGFFNATAVGNVKYVFLFFICL